MEHLSESPLLSEIKNALDQHGAENVIRISITKEAENYEDEGGKFILVKWICWNLADKDGNYVTKPDLNVVHAHLVEGRIEADLEKFFPDNDFIVDNEIYFEEEDE